MSVKAVTLKIIGVGIVPIIFSLSVNAQNCPNGIPSGGNPHCIPPDRPDSPYYNGSGAYVNSAPQERRIIQGYWADRWGAIAIDLTAGKIGSVVGLKNKQLAESLAIKDCKKKGGSDCKISLAYFNQCAAFIVGNKFYYNQSAASLEEAKSLGLKKCSSETNNCKIYYSGCSMAEVEYPAY